MKRRTQIKTLVCLLLILFSLTILFLHSDIGFPDGLLSFRWQERQQMVGPSKILDTLDIPMVLYDRVTIGRSDYGYTLYFWNKEYPKLSDDFFYCPKNEDITLAYSVEMDLIPYMEGWQHPFFVFSEDPAAVKANFLLELTVDDKVESYQLEAARQYDCLFLFSLNGDIISRESFLHYLKACESPADCSSRILVTLYDRNDTLLASLER